MTFLKKLKSYFLEIFKDVKLFPFNFFNKGPEKSLNYEEYVNIYHAEQFSVAFVNEKFITLFGYQQLNELITYIINSIQQYIKNDTSIFINIICTLVLIDNIGITYTHSLTYKKLFKINDLLSWEKQLLLNINEISNRYNDSNLRKIEIRFDYIKKPKQ